MKWKCFQTIRGQLVFAISITVIILAVIFNFYSYKKSLNESEIFLNKEVEKKIELAKASLIFPLWNMDMQTIYTITSALIEQQEIVEIKVTNEYGDILVLKEKKELMRKSSKIYTAKSVINYNEKKIGFVEIYITNEYKKIEIMKNTLYNCIIAIVQILLIIFVIQILSEKITEPLSNMELVAKEIANGRLDNNIDLKGNEEIISLGNVLLKMQKQLKEQSINIKNSFNELNMKNELIERNNLEITALYEETSAMNEELENLVDKLQKAYKETVLSLANAIEVSDPYTRGHCERVRQFSLDIASVMELNSYQKEILEFGAVLHDVGKIGIPSEIINKPDRLTDEEYEIIKKHSTIGYEMVKSVEFLSDAAEIIYQHHERYDGKGYPRGIKGDEISLLAKIVAVADSYDAMTSKRPYRIKALSQVDAIAQITGGIGTLYDETVVKAFLNVLEEKNIIEL